jgi:hypothetical protein
MIRHSNQIRYLTAVIVNVSKFPDIPQWMEAF